VVADGTDPGVWTRIRAMAAAWREALNVWEDVRTKVDEYRELDDERVFALLSWSGRGKTSGFDLADVPWTGANVFHIWAHPEIEFVIADGPSPSIWTGPDAADG
jgi:hypothetical protein